MDKKDLHLVFIDLEKTYDKVAREILWKAIRRKRLRLFILELSMICMRELQLV